MDSQKIKNQTAAQFKSCTSQGLKRRSGGLLSIQTAFRDIFSLTNEQKVA